MTSFESIGIIQLSGSECFTFLNNQTISKIEPSEGIKCHYSAICNPKGRVLYSFFVFTDAEQIHLAVTQELATELFNFLNMRRFRMDVKVIQSETLTLCRTDGSVDNNLYPLALIDKDKAAEAQSIWPTLFEWQLPWIEKAYQEKHIPQHLSLDEAGAIDFKKGCYPGQEIIARLHYLGEVKKRLKLIQVDENDLNQPKVPLSGTFKWSSDAQQASGDWYRQAVINLPK